MRRFVLVGALALVGLACEDDGGESVAAKLDELEEVVDARLQILCDCLGTDDAFCEGEREVDRDYKRCFVAALESDPGADAFLDCSIDVERTYNACISRAECSADCLDDYGTKYDDCNARIREATLAAILECRDRFAVEP